MRIMRTGEARRVATNLTARADLVRAARELDLNLSEIFERAMVEAVRRKRGEDWLASNREAIDSYNEKVESQGVFSDAWRKF